MKKWAFLLCIVPAIAFAQARSQADILLDHLQIEQQTRVIERQLQSRYVHLLKGYEIPPNQWELEKKYQERAFNLAKDRLNPEELKPLMIEKVESIYSKEELVQLNVFFSSEVGQKFLRKQSRLLDGLNQVVRGEQMLIEEVYKNLVKEFVKSAGLQPIGSPNNRPVLPIPAQRPPLSAPPSRPAPSE